MNANWFLMIFSHLFHAFTIVELPGCHTQAKTHDELIERTKEAISLVLSMRKPTDCKTKFLGLQQVEVEV